MTKKKNAAYCAKGQHEIHTTFHLKKKRKFEWSVVAMSLLFSCSYIYAQTDDTSHFQTADVWIEKMSDKIAMDISLNDKYEIFEVKTPTNKFILYPNAPLKLRMKFNYRFISFAFQFAPDFIPGNGDEDIKGKTKAFGVETSLIFNHWFLDVAYSQVRGFYLENTEEYIPWVDGDPYIQFPDLNYYGFAISSGYIGNSNFSLRSLASQTERQLKSAGTFIPVFNFRYYIMDDQSAGTTTQKSNNIEGGIGPGYAYTFVIKEKFYMSLGLLGSMGYLNTKLTTRQPTGDLITNQDNLIFRWDGKSGIGYNGHRFYSGIYANVSGTRYNQENTTAVNIDTRVFYHLFVGVRIKAPDYVAKQLDKIEAKFPK